MVLMLGFASIASAQEDVRLAEVVPSLDGTELGNLPVAHAPPVGASLTVRKSDVLRALKAAGVDAQGFTIPSSTRISRKLIQLRADELRLLAENALAEAVGSCELLETRVPSQVSVAEGPRNAHAELGKNLHTGQVSALLVIENGGHQTRVGITASLRCPDPEMKPGKQITLVAKVGNVTATAPGEARQQGRVGDVIFVVNRATNAQLRGRVLDAQSVEILQ